MAAECLLRGIRLSTPVAILASVGSVPPQLPIEYGTRIGVPTHLANSRSHILQEAAWTSDKFHGGFIGMRIDQRPKPVVTLCLLVAFVFLTGCGEPTPPMK